MKILFFVVVGLFLGLLGIVASAADYETGQLLVVERDSGERELVQWKAPEDGGECLPVKTIRRPTAEEWGAFIDGHPVTTRGVDNAQATAATP